MRRALVLLVVLLAGCRQGMDTPRSGSGVQGMVVSGPHCPVERADSPCPDLPVAGADVVALDENGEAAGTDTSDDDGRFGMPLPPGTYTVTVRGLNGISSAKGVSVVVRTGRVEEVTILVDTGIR